MRFDEQRYFRIGSIIKRIFVRHFPEGIFKKYIYCIYSNLVNKNEFNIRVIEDYYEIKLLKDGTTIKLYDFEGISIYKILFEGYLKNYCIKEGDFVVDAGAYVGSFAIYAAKKVGILGKVIAFEPDNKSYEKLKRNISLNNLPNVIALNKGLWNTDDIIKLNVTDNHLGSSLICEECGINHSTVQIPVVSLDKELRRLNIKYVNFIKMDIEGAEIEAIDGCTRILNDFSVSLAIASYHIRNGKPTSSLLTQKFLEIGYSAETSYPRHLTTYAYKYKDNSLDLYSGGNYG